MAHPPDQCFIQPLAGGNISSGLGQPTAYQGGRVRRHATSFLILITTFLFFLHSSCYRQHTLLHIYTWADYISPELLREFESKFNCRIVIDTFDSNESMYAKLKAGATGYDLITPSSYMVKVMYHQGLLLPLDHSLLANLRHVDPEYLRMALDPAMHHSVPYLLTCTGLAYLKSQVPNFQPSWRMLDRVDLAGRMTMLNDMRETIGAGLKSLGYSLNSRDARELEAACHVVLRWKKNLAKFENEQYKTGLASGEFRLVHGYSGDILQVQKENADVQFAVPVEGTSLACDDLAIPKNARQSTLAHQFINFMHDPEAAARNTSFISYLCPNKTSYMLLNEKIRSNPAIFINPEIRARSEIIDDLGPDNAKYTRIWDQIKAVRIILACILMLYPADSPPPMRMLS